MHISSAAHNSFRCEPGETVPAGPSSMETGTCKFNSDTSDSETEGTFPSPYEETVMKQC